jgi:hypothetical protein
MKLLLGITAMVTMLAMTLSLCYADKAEHFILTGQTIYNSHKNDEFVTIGEKLLVSELKRRFKRYRVAVTAGEDCAICATIFGKGGSIEVDFDEDGKSVIGIFSLYKKSSDALGNSIGSSLRNAIGTIAQCDAGAWTSCRSKLYGLSYIVDSKKCFVRVAGDGNAQETNIPACARILKSDEFSFVFLRRLRFGDGRRPIAL